MFRLYDKIKNNEVYFIAEMSANHGGSLENALEIVRQAAKAGADCLKIQTYTADSLTIDCDNEYFKIHGTLWDGYKLYDLYQDAGTPYEWQGRIKEECERCGIDFLSTPFDNDAVDFLENLGCEAYKIASFELVDIPLIEYAASKGKPMIISCGMGSEENIKDCLEACHRAGNDQVVLLKCCSSYPANWPDMHLANIPDMHQKYGVPVGLSDHSQGYLADVVGATLGACVIEKHVKLPGVESADSKFSMTMEEFAEMVQAVKAAKEIAKGPDYTISEGEKSSMIFRRSLFIVKDVKAGDVIEGDCVRSIRPGVGVLPKHLPKVIGKIAPRDLRRGEPVTQELLEALQE
jgi:pseudaminic acid synthase